MKITAINITDQTIALELYQHFSEKFGAELCELQIGKDGCRVTVTGKDHKETRGKKKTEESTAH